MRPGEGLPLSDLAVMLRVVTCNTKVRLQRPAHERSCKWASLAGIELRNENTPEAVVNSAASSETAGVGTPNVSVRG